MNKLNVSLIVLISKNVKCKRNSKAGIRLNFREGGGEINIVYSVSISPECISVAVSELCIEFIYHDFFFSKMYEFFSRTFLILLAIHVNSKRSRVYQGGRCSVLSEKFYLEISTYVPNKSMVLQCII